MATFATTPFLSLQAELNFKHNNKSLEKMRKNGNDLGEIVIVGSRYGKLADVITPLYSQEGPIEQKDIRSIWR